MNGLQYVEAALATLVVLWLTAGLLAHPAVFGIVGLFALLPLALVVLPALGIHVLGERSVSVRRLPPIETTDGSTRPRPGQGFPSDD